MPRSRFREAARLLPVLVALVALPATGSSQETERRPELPPWGDPGSAQAYFDEAAAILNQDPERATELFKWAARLDPEWAEPLEGWRAAVLLTERLGLRSYMSRRERSEAGRLADSLRYQASIRNPFGFRPFEGELVQAYVRTLARGADPIGRATPELEYSIASLLRQDPIQRARLAYSEYDLDLALELYEEAIERAPQYFEGAFQSEKGHVHALAGRYAEARAAYGASVAALRAIDETLLLSFYESKALQLYSMGLLSELMENPERARTDYGLALEEDLSFHPAHEGLARLALAAGDTATALFEYRMAVDLAPYEPALRMKLAGILLLTGDVPAAEEQARAAVQANPYYAAPHLVLGALADRAGKARDAIGHYERFLEMASQTDRNRGTAQNRLAALQIAIAGGGDP